MAGIWPQVEFAQDSAAGPEAIGFQVVLKAVIGSIREALLAGR
jgi:hypothetical protein